MSMSVSRVSTLICAADQPDPGPARPPAPPRSGLLSRAAAVARLPADLLVAVAYTARELPYLVQALTELLRAAEELAQTRADVEREERGTR